MWFNRINNYKPQKIKALFTSHIFHMALIKDNLKDFSSSLEIYRESKFVVAKKYRKFDYILTIF